MKQIFIFLFVSLFSFFLHAQNESEPNNSFEQADPVQESLEYAGFINDSQDVDYFRFNVNEPGIIKLQVFSVPDDIDITAKIYHPDKVTEIRKKEGVLNGEGYELEVSTCETGFHYLVFEDEHFGSSGQFNTEDSYNIRVEFTPFSEVDNCECQNNSFDTMCELSDGVSYNGLIVPWFNDQPYENDIDYYKFEVTEPGILKLDIYSVPDNLDLWARIVHPDQITEIRRKEGVLNGEAYTLEVSTCEIGYHYIIIEEEYFGSWGLFNSGDQYTIKVEFTPFLEDDACECFNNEFETTCELDDGVPYQGQIVPVFDDLPADNDIDYYKFEVTEPGILKLDIYNVPDNLDLWARIVHPDELTEIRKEVGVLNGEAYTLEVSTCEVGYHYIIIEDEYSSTFGSYNSEDQYTIKVEFTPFSEVDACECFNNDFETTCELYDGVSYQGVIAPVFNDLPADNDIDYYKFDVSEPGIIKLNVFNVPDNLDLSARIYSPDQFTEIMNRTGVLNGEAYALEVSTCQIGYHYIVIEDEYSSTIGPFNSEDQYNLRVDFTPFSEIDNTECNGSFEEAHPIELCDTIQAAIVPWFEENSQDFDEDYYSISLNENDVIDIIISSVPEDINICLKIYNEAEELIEEYNEGNGETLIESFTAEYNGTYYLRVSDCGYDFNSEDQYNFYVGCNLVNSTVNLDNGDFLEVYPNPFNYYFSIELKSAREQMIEISVLDLYGNLLLSFNQMSNGIIDLPTSELPAGIYLLNVKIEGSHFSTKVVKI